MKRSLSSKELLVWWERPILKTSYKTKVKRQEEKSAQGTMGAILGTWPDPAVSEPECACPPGV